MALNMRIYGHRGAAGEAPESTLAGVRHLLRLGIRRLEIDLRLSADGEIMVNHDAGLRRTSGCAGNISSMSAAAITQSTATSRYPVSTLARYLCAFPELKHVQLEIKPAPAATLVTLARRLAQTLVDSGRDLAHFCATSSDPRALSAITRTLPLLDRGVVVLNASALRELHQYRCRYACVHHRLLTRWQVTRLRRQNVNVSAWTVNDPVQMRRLRSWGCDSIITDYPRQALAALHS